MQIGMIGLGRMGANMTRRLLRGGHLCVVHNKTPEPVQALVAEGAHGASSYADLVRQLQPPRVVWLMIPAGAVDTALESLLPLLTSGDIGLFTSIFPIGGIIGPNLGGWMVSRYSWRYIFYINLPIGIVLIVLIMMLLQDSKVFSRPHIDFKGVSFFSGGILFLMLGLNLMGESFSASTLPYRSHLLSPQLFLTLLISSSREERLKPNLRYSAVKVKTLSGSKSL